MLHERVANAGLAGSEWRAGLAERLTSVAASGRKVASEKSERCSSLDCSSLDSCRRVVERKNCTRLLVHTSRLPETAYCSNATLGAVDLSQGAPYGALCHATSSPARSRAC